MSTHASAEPTARVSGFGGTAPDGAGRLSKGGESGETMTRRVRTVLLVIALLVVGVLLARLIGSGESHTSFVYEGFNE